MLPWSSSPKMLASAPQDILQTLTEVALRLCQAHFAGVSLLEDGDRGRRFHWRAIAREMVAACGGGTPRDFGAVRDGPQLRRAAAVFQPERDFPYIGEITPAIEDALLVPFHVRRPGRRHIGSFRTTTPSASTPKFAGHDQPRQIRRGGLPDVAREPSLGSDQRDSTIRDDGAAFRLHRKSSDDAVVSKTLDGVITSWNKGAERIFGYTAEEAIGQHITFLMRPRSI